MIYNIIEVANSHGGKIDYIYSLIEEFSRFNKSDGFGMKFQAFKYDRIATKDYPYYNLYTHLFIDEIIWRNIIEKAFETKDVWLDIFDDYGITILENNLEKITGIKLQSSVLFNERVINLLRNLDMSSKQVVINVAAQEVTDIKNRVEKISAMFQPKELLIEVGFQAYPTSVEDAGLNKIKVIKEHFDNRVVFADHVDGTSEDAVWFPVIASLMGVDIVEKHVMHSNLETKYDAFSSITVSQYEKYIELQKKYLQALNQGFIVEKEEKYLENTLQIPILKVDVAKGKLIPNEFLDYKRSGKGGVSTQEVDRLRAEFSILSVDKKSGETLHFEDFKRASIATVIACRLKSTRLPKKALLPIGKYTSIELCIKNSLKFENTDYTVLATSSLDSDVELSYHTFREDVIFHQGDPDDVIDRYLGIADKLNLDVIIRLTGDCPYVSNDVCQLVLKSHFASGADYSWGVGAAVGTNIEVINVSAMREIKEHFQNAKYSEYMTWYFINNPEHFKINEVQLPQKWSRDYRLTLDYQEDLDLFNQIEKYFDEYNIDYTIDKLFEFLDNNPDIAAINSHLTLKYKTDQNLIDALNRETKIK